MIRLLIPAIGQGNAVAAGTYPVNVSLKMTMLIRFQKIKCYFVAIN